MYVLLSVIIYMYVYKTQGRVHVNHNHSRYQVSDHLVIAIRTHDPLVTKLHLFPLQKSAILRIDLHHARFVIYTPEASGWALGEILTTLTSQLRLQKEYI